MKLGVFSSRLRVLKKINELIKNSELIQEDTVKYHVETNNEARNFIKTVLGYE